MIKHIVCKFIKWVKKLPPVEKTYRYFYFKRIDVKIRISFSLRNTKLALKDLWQLSQIRIMLILAILFVFCIIISYVLFINSLAIYWANLLQSIAVGLLTGVILYLLGSLRNVEYMRRSAYKELCAGINMCLSSIPFYSETEIFKGNPIQMAQGMHAHYIQFMSSEYGDSTLTSRESILKKDYKNTILKHPSMRYLRNGDSIKRLKEYIENPTTKDYLKVCNDYLEFKKHCISFICFTTNEVANSNRLLYLLDRKPL